MKLIDSSKQKLRTLMYEPSGSGGLTYYTESLCQALTNAGADVTWLTSSLYETAESHLSGVHVNNSLPPLTSEGRLLRIRPYWALNRLAIVGYSSFKRNRLAREMRPDVVHIQYSVPRVEQYMMRGLKVPPLVYTVHDIVPHSDGPHWSATSLRRVYNLADHLIVHTRENQKQLMEEFFVPANKLSLIPHGANIAKTINPAYAKREIGLDQDAPVILFFGAIRRNKGLQILLQALPDVISKIGPCKLVIAGTTPFGEDYSEYSSIINSTGILDSVSVNNRFIQPIADPVSLDTDLG